MLLVCLLGSKYTWLALQPKGFCSQIDECTKLNLHVDIYASAFGISRSTTVVLAYLMRKEGRRLDLVMENVRLRKTDIR